MVFIAFEERENLGVRYMAAVLSCAGYKVAIIDFRKDNTEILEELIKRKPFLVGFSVIFERTIYLFRDLIEYLRINGVQCHFTAGGHFASLRPGLLFELLPSIDSIVRFEGEYTVLDLAKKLQSGTTWTEIIGLSYLREGKLVNNRPRALEPDLDRFPYPTRTEFKPYVLDKKHTSILAGRGCSYNCSFCDTREFFRRPPGAIKRIRDPTKVVEEMASLYNEQECSVFLFEDEDFPVVSKSKSDWVNTFCRALKEKELKGEVMWKISCRADEIEESSIVLMKQHGLFSVFMGLEDGTDSGLFQMKKHLSVSDSLAGISTLKELEVGIEFGFMLFQPETTFNSLRENLDFLKEICGDGYMAVYFNRMLPFLETRIRKDLEKEGRLKGKPGFLDYDFHDREMNDLYAFIDDVFDTWITAPDGLTNIAKWGDIYLRVYDFYYGNIKSLASLRKEYRDILADSNSFIIGTLKDLSFKFESGHYDLEKDEKLYKYRVAIAEKQNSAKMKIIRITNRVHLVTLVKEVYL